MKAAQRRTAFAFKALGEPRRMELLQLLRARPMAVGELAETVDITQQAVSQHLAVLRRAGFVESTRHGTRNVFAIRQVGFQPIAAFAQAFWQPRLEALKEAIERES